MEKIGDFCGRKPLSKFQSLTKVVNIDVLICKRIIHFFFLLFFLLSQIYFFHNYQTVILYF